MGLQKQKVKHDGYLDALDACQYGVHHCFKCQEFTHGKRSRSNRSNWWKILCTYKAEADTQGIERAREICENVNGVLATQLDDQQFQSIFETEKLFFRKGGMLWIDAVYNIFEDRNMWTWANTEDEITAIKTSPTTEQELCGVMDAQMDYEPPIYQPLIVGHDCGWSDLSENIDILCMSDEPIFD